MNGTCLIPRPLSYLPGHIFRFFVSCTGPEEIVPVGTRGSERNNNNNNKTTMPPIEVIANCELCMTKYGVNRLIGSKDIAKTNI